MSEAMERIVGAYVKAGNLRALQELQVHRSKILETLTSLRDLDIGLAVRQNQQELEIVRSGIARLTQQSTS